VTFLVIDTGLDMRGLLAVTGDEALFCCLGEIRAGGLRILGISITDEDVEDVGEGLFLMLSMSYNRFPAKLSSNNDGPATRERAGSDMADKMNQQC